MTWQPGAVPVASTVSLAAADTKLALAGTGVSLDVEPPVTSLPWPVDIAYASAPTGQVVGFSTDGRIWIPVAALTGTTLPAGLTQGTYLSGSTLHVLTKQAGPVRAVRRRASGATRRSSPRTRRCCGGSCA